VTYAVNVESSVVSPEDAGKRRDNRDIARTDVTVLMDAVSHIQQYNTLCEHVYPNITLPYVLLV
jgi:hypothetical protein